MAEQTKLSGCPFCGGAANIHRLGSFSNAIHCERCPSSMMGEDRDALVSAWNRREKLATTSNVGSQTEERTHE